MRVVSALADGDAPGLELVAGWSKEGWQNAVDRRADSEEQAAKKGEMVDEKGAEDVALGRIIGCCWCRGGSKE